MANQASLHARRWQEIEAPQGRYQSLCYDGKRPVYTDLGEDPTQALSKFKVLR